LLLPEAVDAYVCADNPVRFIDAFVDELDLSAAGFVRVATRPPLTTPTNGLAMFNMADDDLITRAKPRNHREEYT
jgi:hypothetical protein